MKIKLHPVLLPFFLFLFITGGLSLYVLIFISLLIHEAGHVIAAKIAGMRIRSCTILPYGGELSIPRRHMHSKRARIAVAMGGPAATAFLLLLVSILPFPGSDQLAKIQVILLCINLLPILPLDGGQALCALVEMKEKRHISKSLFLMGSIISLLVILLVLYSSFPKSILYMCLVLFLLIQNIAAYRYRRYENAYERLTKKQLTP